MTDEPEFIVESAEDDDTAIVLGRIILTDGEACAFIEWDGDEMPIMSDDVYDQAFVISVLESLHVDIAMGAKIAEAMAQKWGGRGSVH